MQREKQDLRAGRKVYYNSSIRIYDGLKLCDCGTLGIYTLLPQKSQVDTPSIFTISPSSSSPR